jgi:hypothetical protein
MKKRLGWISVAGTLSIIVLGSELIAQDSAPGTPVSVVVTVEPKRGKEIPSLDASDITVKEGKEDRPITSLTPLHSQAGQLLLMIDDSARGTFDTELPTLKTFVNSLPAEMEVGVDYMRNGTNQMTCAFTRDHAEAANSIRVALGPGGADVSPYDSLTQAVKEWPIKPDVIRREVVIISSGIEELGGGFAPDNPYVNAGIESAQKAGIVVYTIYSPSVGHAGHSFWRATWGQNFLSQLSDETGGESYMIGYGSPVDFGPYLNSILQRQKEQYVLTFVAKAEKKAGLQYVKIAVKEKDASLAAPDRVFVKAGM